MSRALQVYLQETEFKALREWAAERGWTLSQAVRAALKVLTQPRVDDAQADPLLASSGMIDGLPADLSQRFGDYLAHTFVAEPPSRFGAEPKKRRRRASKPVRR
jgi:hypothetical protein